MYGITKYIDSDINEHYITIENFLNQAEYKKAEEEYSELIKKVDKGISSELDSVINLMEAFSKDAAFDAGFAEGINFAIKNKLQG